MALLSSRMSCLQNGRCETRALVRAPEQGAEKDALPPDPHLHNLKSETTNPSSNGKRNSHQSDSDWWRIPLTIWTWSHLSCLVLSCPCLVLSCHGLSWQQQQQEGQQQQGQHKQKQNGPPVFKDVLFSKWVLWGKSLGKGPWTRRRKRRAPPGHHLHNLKTEAT